MTNPAIGSWPDRCRSALKRVGVTECSHISRLQHWGTVEYVAALRDYLEGASAASSSPELANLADEGIDIIHALGQQARKSA